MAIPLSTYGNTLSELQAGTNAAQALDYQRANAQDAISQQRLEAFLRLRGQELQAKAQQNRDAAERAQRMAELLQQNSQFGTSEANRMKLADIEARTRENVAKTTAEARGLDPRVYQMMTEYQAMNDERAQLMSKGQQLSAARIAALAEKKKLKDAQGWTDLGDPNVSFFNRRVNPRWTELNDTIAKLDAEALRLGFAPSPDGGYVLGAPATTTPTIPQDFKSFSRTDVIPFSPTPPSALTVPPPAPNTGAVNVFDFYNGQLAPAR